MKGNFVKILAIVAPLLALTGCEFGTKVVEQVGPRGTGQQLVADKSGMKKAGVVPPPPYPLTPDMLQGPRAGVTYQNVKVLGDISTDQFNYTMAAITTWIAPPEQGCNYCHNPANMASDEKYTKVVARRMLQMTQNINANWKPHFAQVATAAGGTAMTAPAAAGAGVTCWTCHRGNAVPVNHWSNAVADPRGIKGNKHGQDTPLQSVAYASLPYDSFSSYLSGQEQIRVQGTKQLRNPGHVVPISQTEKTYGLMMHMSQSLGVNCSFCHNSQAFGNWALSRPTRVNAWYGIRMVREINNSYINSLDSVWPANRRGPAGDPLKVNCATCHQGIQKPLGGYHMLKDYPALAGPTGPVAAPVTATAPAAVPPATTAMAAPPAVVPAKPAA